MFDALATLLDRAAAAFGALASLLRNRGRSVVPWKEADMHFLQRGMQYYVSGRFAALAQELPVCANLLHHSLEMFLKAALCRVHGKGQLHAMGHNLWKAWLAFKLAYPDSRLEGFDATVRVLNKFERIRYPDEVLRKGMIATFDLFREHKSHSQSYSAKNPPQYKLNLEDVDHLVVVYFEVAQFNPGFLLNSMSPSSRAVLIDRNRHLLTAA